jgi:hypothetical protein
MYLVKRYIVVRLLNNTTLKPAGSSLCFLATTTIAKNTIIGETAFWHAITESCVGVYLRA